MLIRCALHSATLSSGKSSRMVAHWWVLHTAMALAAVAMVKQRKV